LAGLFNVFANTVRNPVQQQKREPLLTHSCLTVNSPRQRSG